MNKEEKKSTRLESVRSSHNFYNEALKIAKTSEQKARVYANLTQANKTAGELQDHESMRLYHFNEQVEMLNKALFFGQGNTDKAFIDKLTERGRLLYSDLKDILKHKTLDAQVE